MLPKEIIRHLVEDILQWDDEQIKKRLTFMIFLKNNVYNTLKDNYNGDIFLALNDAFPNRFKRWEIKPIPRGYWNEKTAAYAVQWLFEMKLDNQKLDIKSFRQNGLAGVLRLFDHDINAAIYNAYPEKRILVIDNYILIEV